MRDDWQPGQVLRLYTARGRELGVFVRRNRNGKPIIRKVYFGMGAPIPMHDDDLHVVTDEKAQDLADAIAIALDAKI